MINDHFPIKSLRTSKRLSTWRSSRRRRLFFDHDDPITDLYRSNDRPPIRADVTEPWERMETRTFKPRKHQWGRSILEVSLDPPQTNITGSRPTNWFVWSAWVWVDCCQPGGSDLSPSTFIHSFPFTRKFSFISQGDRKGLTLGSWTVKTS